MYHSHCVSEEICPRCKGTLLHLSVVISLVYMARILKLLFDFFVVICLSSAFEALILIDGVVNLEGDT